MKNPSFRELQSLCQINQVCKEENQRMNLTLKNFATPCEIFVRQKEISQPLFILTKFQQARRKFRNSFSVLRNFCNSISELQNLDVIVRYFCTDSVRFLPQDILCNYLFSLIRTQLVYALLIGVQSTGVLQFQSSNKSNQQNL